MFAELEETVRRDLNHAEEQAQKAHAHMMIIGILPTLTEELLNGDALSANPRYKLLNEQIFAARGEDLQINIDGRRAARDLRRHDRPRGRLHERAAAPDDRSGARSARTGTRRRRSRASQLAIGANSPFFFGRELWRETRIALFEQTTDTRPEELKAQGVRPRVWFGERWITSIFDLFEENVRYFPALLPVVEDEDPVAVLERGGAPSCRSCACTTARSTAGTGRSTTSRAAARTCASRTACCRPARRSSTRSPTPPSTTGSCACWSRTTARSGRQMSFSAAEENFHAGASDGLDARAVLARLGEVPATELVLRRLLPMARDGLARWGVDAADADRLLEIIERRCVDGVNGASWQAAASTGSTTASTAPTRCAR